MALTTDIEFLSRPLPGETANGDAAVIRRSGSRALVAVIDALGHGPAAAECSEAGRAFLAGLDLSVGTVADWMQGLHQALHGGRGAAAMLCSLEGERLTGVGVGNISLRARGAKVSAYSSAGILGRGQLRLHPFEGELAAGARLALFSDGVSSRLDLEQLKPCPAAEACAQIMATWGRPTDDATIVVVQLTDEGTRPSTRA